MPTIGAIHSIDLMHIALWLCVFVGIMFVLLRGRRSSIMSRFKAYEVIIESQRDRKVRYTFFACSLVIFFIGTSTTRYGYRLSGDIVAAVGATGLALTGLVIPWLRLSRFLMKLRESDYFYCPQCHYCLHGLGMSGRCPECGRYFEHSALRQEWRYILGEIK